HAIRLHHSRDAHTLLFAQLAHRWDAFAGPQRAVFDQLGDAQRDLLVQSVLPFRLGGDVGDQSLGGHAGRIRLLDSPDSHTSPDIGPVQFFTVIKLLRLKIFYSASVLVSRLRSSWV